MPLHDWTHVDAGIFHDFHVAWIAEIRKALNGGLLPEGYYALAEQHAGRAIADVLTLHASPAAWTQRRHVADAPGDGRSRPGRCASPGAAPAHGRTGRAGPPPLPGHPPRQRPPPRRPHRDRLAGEQGPLPPRQGLRRQGRVRPGPRRASAAGGPVSSRPPRSLGDAWRRPPGARGVRGAVRRARGRAGDAGQLRRGPVVEIYVEHVAIGAALPEMPLFLHSDRYVNVPLEPTYQAAYDGMPAFWRGVRAPAPRSHEAP